MSPGDLLMPRRGIFGTLSVGIRVYSDKFCDTWRGTFLRHDQVVFMIDEHKNEHSQDVLTVLTDSGLGWVYKVDMEVADEAG